MKENDQFENLESTAEVETPQAPPGSSLPETLPEATITDLPERLQQGAARAGWTELMPVQAKAIPYLFAQRDMMIQSRTGSGKTGAYLLPIFELINAYDPSTQALVLVPTRELAQQVTAEAEILGSATGVRCIAVYGGVGYGKQLEALQAGAHLVVGTPGRVLDHLLRRSMSLKKLKFLIFDEADRMLSMGFYPDMRRVQSYLPQEPINTYMFSATFPPQVIRLAHQFMQNPGFLNLSSDHVHVTETEHIYYTVPGMDKDRSLVRVIEVENPLSALVFCNTKARVEYVTVILQRYGYDADYLSSDLPQAARDRVLDRVRQGTLRFLVATDVAARGIDLPELSHVIQYETPEDPEGYIHRAGRTGRAGASGTAISLTNVSERANLLRIGKRFSINFQERQVPSEEEVEAVVAERITAILEAHMRSRDKLQTERMERFIPLSRQMGETDEGASLLAMLLDDFYHKTFHGPVVPKTEEEVRPARRRDEERGGGDAEQKRNRRPRRPRGRQRRE